MYELWDVETDNLVGEYDDEVAARSAAERLFAAATGGAGAELESQIVIVKEKRAAIHDAAQKAERIAREVRETRDSGKVLALVRELRATTAAIRKGGGTAAR